MKKWLKHEDEILITLYGKTNKEFIHEKLDGKYSWGAIKNRARKLDLTNKRNNKQKNVKWTDDLIDKFSKIWVSGTSKEIQSEFSDFSYEALTSAAKRFGVKRNVEFSYENKLSKLLIENNFNSYWLGFIMADGHFSSRNELKINVSIEDIKHLKLLGDYLCVNIHERKGQSYGKYTSKDSCGISVMDVNSIKKLKIKFSITNNKTYEGCDLTKLNEKYYLPFLCGLIDGDGCITQSKIGKANMLRIQCHSSWFDNLKMFSDFLNETFGFNSKVKIDKSGYTNFAMYRNKELLKLKQEIEKYEIPYLRRKWDKIV